MQREIEVTVATEVTDELVRAFARLIPQLSTTATPPDRKLLSEIISAPANTVLVAKDASSGQIIGTLTLVMFRIRPPCGRGSRTSSWTPAPEAEESARRSPRRPSGSPNRGARAPSTYWRSQ
jgi:hypothetical protein